MVAEIAKPAGEKWEKYEEKNRTYDIELLHLQISNLVKNFYAEVKIPISQIQFEWIGNRSSNDMITTHHLLNMKISFGDTQ